jgi:hypothetical protein
MGCDANFPKKSTAGPPIAVVTTGTNIAAGSTYTVDQPIKIAFNRFLNPETVTRQSLVLEDLNGVAITDALVSYDPVTLTVSLSNPGSGLGWLDAGHEYQVVLTVPSGDGGTYGLQAIDGATLAAAQTIQFKAGAAPAIPSSGPPTIDFCNDIYYPILSANGVGCASQGCHEAALPMVESLFDGGGTGYPREGLDLSTVSGIRATAIGQVAHESNTGPYASPATPSASLPFGVDMPIIAPGQPGNSWLMYKVLLGPVQGVDAGLEDAASSMTSADAAEDAPSSMTAADASEDAPGTMTGSSPSDAGLEDAAGAMTAADACVVTPPKLLYGTGPVNISAGEQTILSNYILGNPMPYTGYGTKLTEAQLEQLSVWIAQGAVTPEQQCEPVCGGGS